MQKTAVNCGDDSGKEKRGVKNKSIEYEGRNFVGYDSLNLN